MTDPDRLAQNSVFGALPSTVTTTETDMMHLITRAETWQRLSYFAYTITFEVINRQEGLI